MSTTNPLAQTLAGPVFSALRGVIEGTDEDLRTYALEIAQDVADVAASEHAEARLDELEAQGLLLLERRRLAIQKAGESIFRGVIRGVTSVAIAVASAGLAGVLASLPQQTQQTQQEP